MLRGILILGVLFAVTRVFGAENALVLNDREYFECRGLNILVFSNWYNANFGDSKMSGVEIIQHGVRTATNGDIRLGPTPAQWDPLPEFVERKVFREQNRIEAFLRYPAYDFEYTIRVDARGKEALLTVVLPKPLPHELEGHAGLNVEFLPPAYFEKTYLMDGKPGLFPLYPSGPMVRKESGSVEPGPLASGTSLVLAPEDAERRVAINAGSGRLLLYDGRNTAQNGWYVVRSIIPAGKTGPVIEWTLDINTIPGWTRPPVIAHSQVGYHPNQKKIVVIELGRYDTPLPGARLLFLRQDGELAEVYRGELRRWGTYLRYVYYCFDFSSVTIPGVYVIEYGAVRSRPFRIDPGVYVDAWHPTLDVFFPVQMDHMAVKEAYRVWHGASHLDDALQAPVNHDHFDLYAQGPTTDTPYRPGDHIPGLNVGGWFDAGDFDIRTQTQYAVVLSLAETWEEFRPDRDETTVDQKSRRVEIHNPDGFPDLLQQIEHGVLQLLAQYHAVGHALNGIVASHLSQYTHLGDAASKTDNLMYNPGLDSLQREGMSSGKFDDRWAFTTRATALDYGSAAALAAASRVLPGYNDSLARECFAVATRIWNDEHDRPPFTFRHGNTTGGELEDEELRAAVELLICTKDDRYAQRVRALMPAIEKRFAANAVSAVRAMPFMDASYSMKLEQLTKAYAGQLETLSAENPFGVPVSTGGWAGNGLVIGFARNNYALHKAFPALIDPEYVYKGLNYVFGCHPGSEISFVSGVGTQSKKVAYGNNRADYSFIAGGVVPGVLILPPDFPENKEDWPFLWGENEYVVNLAAQYIYVVHAANDLVNQMK